MLLFTKMKPAYIWDPFFPRLVLWQHFTLLPQFTSNLFSVSAEDYSDPAPILEKPFQLNSYTLRKMSLYFALGIFSHQWQVCYKRCSKAIFNLFVLSLSGCCTAGKGFLNTCQYVWKNNSWQVTVFMCSISVHKRSLQYFPYILESIIIGWKCIFESELGIFDWIGYLCCMFYFYSD